MNAAEFVAELERLGKWEVEREHKIDDGASEANVVSKWISVAVDFVRRTGFTDVDGWDFDFDGAGWRFPGKPKPDFLTWIKAYQEKSKADGSDKYDRYVDGLIDDYEAGRDP